MNRRNFFVRVVSGFVAARLAPKALMPKPRVVDPPAEVWNLRVTSDPYYKYGFSGFEEAERYAKRYFIGGAYRPGQDFDISKPLLVTRQEYDAALQADTVQSAAAETVRPRQPR